MHTVSLLEILPAIYQLFRPWGPMLRNWQAFSWHSPYLFHKTVWLWHMTMTAVYIDMLISRPSSGLRLHLSTIYIVLVPNTSKPRD